MTFHTDELVQTVAAYEANDRNQRATALALGLARSTLQNRLRRAAERGLLGFSPVLEGFKVAQVTNTPNGDYIKQKPDLGAPYEPVDGLALKGKTTWAEVRPDGSRVAVREVLMERADARAQADVFAATVAALKEDLPRLAPTPAPAIAYERILNQYTVTDNHFGMLAWREESGADYDLRIAEQLLLDWFAAEIAQSPRGHTAVFAQLGDLMHHDALESITPAHRHVLDADSRLQKIIRVVIRTIRRVIGMLLDTHKHVHIIMASGNHDPASSAWLREMLATMYENEIRISVDNSPALYYAYEWGQTALFYHHGHKRGLADLDRVFASMFREMYGRCAYHYGHKGHFHKDGKSPANALFPIEEHETLAARDAFASGGGYNSRRSAKRISYDKQFGEVGRSILRPEMVTGAYTAANDNNEQERKAA